MPRESKIKIGERSFTYDWITDVNNSAAQSILRNAKTAKVQPVCCCTPTGVELYIGHREKSGVHYLARMPGSFSKHMWFCELSEATGASSGAGHLPSIEKEGDQITIHLESSLTNRMPSKVTRPDGNDKHSNRAQHDEIKLLGLLRFLWEQSRLDHWYPNRKYPRTWNTVRKSILECSEDITVKGGALRDILFIPERFIENQKDDIEARRRTELAKLTQDPSKGFITIAQVKNVFDVQSGDSCIQTKHTGQDGKFWMSAEVSKRFKKSFPREFDALGKDDVVVVAIIVAFKQGNSLKVSDIGMMSTTKQFIPFDSSYEFKLASHLIEQGRRFRKPIRYHGGLEMLPDFVLLDTANPVAMEVFGIDNNPEYLARKQEKISRFKDSRDQLWYWEATKFTDWPAIPKAIST